MYPAFVVMAASLRRTLLLLILYSAKNHTALLFLFRYRFITKK